MPDSPSADALTLLLLRHAKSSWTDPGIDDRDRPLNARGRKAAETMGRWLSAHGPTPELAICSPARRARETWKIASEQLRSAPRTIVDEAIYDFGNGGRLLDIVSQLAGSARVVLVIGHNPSMERLAHRLAAAGDPKLLNRMRKKFPTAALCAIELPCTNWSEAGDRPGRLVSFVRPRDLDPSSRE
jgi:phosphohistidine phosphatase